MTMTPTLPSYLDSTPGASDAAQDLATQGEEWLGRMQESVFLGLGPKGVFDDLERIFKECRMANWDGYDAVPVRLETLIYTRRFLLALPWGTPPPAVGAEPDGHLTLEWYRSPRRTLSISVSPDGDLHYAALLGPRTRYGTELFVNEVPRVIIDLIDEMSIV